MIIDSILRLTIRIENQCNDVKYQSKMAKIFKYEKNGVINWLRISSSLCVMPTLSKGVVVILLVTCEHNKLIPPAFVYKNCMLQHFRSKVLHLLSVWL